MESDDKKDHKYKKIIGEAVKVDSEGDETLVPYAIEAFLVEKEDPDALSSVRTTFNKSVTYEDDPFRFKDYSRFGKKNYRAGTLKGVLQEAKFTRARGVDLVINVVTPAPEFTDKAKTHIDAEDFKDDLLKATHYVTKNAIKEVEQAERQSRKQNRSHSVYRAPPRTSREDLMRKYFVEAYHHAKGDYASVAARQVFYVIRKLANLRDNETFTTTQYDTFTQKICTEFEQGGYKIAYDRRGFFVNAFDNGHELPLGTLDVEDYISKAKDPKNRIIHKIEERYSVGPEYLFNKLLFIEKEGFTPMFQEADLIKDMSLGIISTKGLGTRAAKYLMRFFEQRGISIYILHDCDVAGYRIAHLLKNGSETFPYPINATDIGINVQDIEDLEKEDEVEEATSGARQGMAHITDPKAIEFFNEHDSGNYYDTKYTYNRLELNTLTNDELIEFIKEKIPNTPIIPDVDVFNSMAADQFKNSEAILKDAVYAAFLAEHEDFREDPDIKKVLKADIDGIMSDVLDDVNNNDAHWIHTLSTRSAEIRKTMTNEISEILQGMY